jgi:ribosomal protein L29
MGQMRAELRHEVAGSGAELRQEIAKLRTEMRAGSAASDAKLERLKAELLRWKFLLWVGTVGRVLAILKLQLPSRRKLHTFNRLRIWQPPLRAAGAPRGRCSTFREGAAELTKTGVFAPGRSLDGRPTHQFVWQRV